MLARLLRGDRPLFALLQAIGTQAFVLAVNVLTGVIAARALGPEGRGVYAAVTLWPPLLAALAVAGSSSGIVFQIRTRPDASSNVAGAFALLGSVQSLLAIAIGILLVPVFMATYAPVVVLFAQFCLISVLVNNAHTWIKQTYAGLGRFRECNLAHLAPQLLYLIALLLIVPFVSIDARDAVLALLGSGAIAVLMLLPKFFRIAQPGLKGSVVEMRRLLSYSARAAPMDVVFALATYADKLVLLRLLPASELGLYAVAFSFSRIVQLVQPAIMSVLLSHMSGKSEAGSKHLHDYACRFLVAGLVAGCGLLWLVSETLLVVIYGADFGAATVLFRLLVIEGSLGVLSQVTAQLFLSRDRPGVVSTIQVIVLGVSVAALLVLTPRYGVTGAALALVGAGVVRWVLLLVALKIALKLPLPRLYLNRGDVQYMLERLR
jgi:O-antigen/teichoic acid export membrane protein